jgi:hypothetical protein
LRTGEKGKDKEKAVRKAERTRILELLQTPDEVHNELRKQAPPQAAARLLADCLDFSLSVAGYIENVAGEGTRTVALLAEYCELLRRAGTGGDENGAKRAKTLRAQFVKVKSAAFEELLPDRIEIAFITWRAMQFDAFESVYLAAKADPVCDVYVVPVPYYEINSDGSLGRMHYEGAEFYRTPNYHPDIKTVHRREYDIEARRPDAIFVNNPYDGNVRNACIHPDYFCERLRGLTDMLVYIPYFTAVGDDVPEEFCTLPGCIHAHKVILESEKIRDTYIRVFGKAFGDRRGKPREKFIALGSPKLDKVINARREDFTLPAGFERLMRGQGGSAKKAVLYNTHMFAWLSGGERYFKRLRAVFETFRSRDDVVLWWRPHPNTELNFRAMRPDLLGAYKALVAGYRRAGFGIYDDTQDLHRSIAWTDAYYGDWSSLVALYRLTGKPVVIQDISAADGESGRGDPCEGAGGTIAVYKEEGPVRLRNCIDRLVRESEAESAASRARRRAVAREQSGHADGAAGSAIYGYVQSAARGPGT